MRGRFLECGERSIRDSPNYTARGPVGKVFFGAPDILLEFGRKKGYALGMLPFFVSGSALRRRPRTPRSGLRPGLGVAVALVAVLAAGSVRAEDAAERARGWEREQRERMERRAAEERARRVAGENAGVAELARISTLLDEVGREYAAATETVAELREGAGYAVPNGIALLARAIQAEIPSIRRTCADCARALENPNAVLSSTRARIAVLSARADQLRDRTKALREFLRAVTNPRADLPAMNDLFSLIAEFGVREPPFGAPADPDDEALRTPPALCAAELHRWVRRDGWGDPADVAALLRGLREMRPTPDVMLPLSEAVRAFPEHARAFALAEAAAAAGLRDRAHFEEAFRTAVPISPDRLVFLEPGATYRFVPPAVALGVWRAAIGRIADAADRIEKRIDANASASDSLMLRSRFNLREYARYRSADATPTERDRLFLSFRAAGFPSTLYAPGGRCRVLLRPIPEETHFLVAENRVASNENGVSARVIRLVPLAYGETKIGEGAVWTGVPEQTAEFLAMARRAGGFGLALLVPPDASDAAAWIPGDVVRSSGWICDWVMVDSNRPAERRIVEPMHSYRSPEERAKLEGSGVLDADSGRPVRTLSAFAREPARTDGAQRR